MKVFNPIEEWEKLGYRLIDEYGVFHIVKELHNNMDSSIATYYHIEIDTFDYDYIVYYVKNKNYMDSERKVCVVSLEEHNLIYKTIEYFQNREI